MELSDTKGNVPAIANFCLYRPIFSLFSGIFNSVLCLSSPLVGHRFHYSTLRVLYTDKTRATTHTQKKPSNAKLPTHKTTTITAKYNNSTIIGSLFTDVSILLVFFCFVCVVVCCSVQSCIENENVAEFSPRISILSSSFLAFVYIYIVTNSSKSHRQSRKTC